MKISKVFIVIAFIGLITCAKKQDFSIELTSSVIGTTENSVELTVVVNGEGKGTITQSGIIYGLSPDPSLETVSYTYSGSDLNYQYGQTHVYSDHKAGNTTTIEITNLPGNARFYYKPFCVVNGQEYLGTLDSFFTDCPTAIGCGPAGGYIIYDDGNGGGIEAAPYDVYDFDGSSYNYNYNWGCTSTSIPGTDSVIGTGQANTTLILAGCPGVVNVSKVCDDFVYGGYSDWYLPSEDEAMLMYTELHDLGYGNFETSRYWSSTENASNGAQGIDFHSGTSSTLYKHQSYRVRAVRTF